MSTEARLSELERRAAEHEAFLQVFAAAICQGLSADTEASAEIVEPGTPGASGNASAGGRHGLSGDAAGNPSSEA